jgi:hypothetical protein
MTAVREYRDGIMNGPGAIFSLTGFRTSTLIHALGYWYYLQQEVESKSQARPLNAECIDHAVTHVTLPAHLPRPRARPNSARARSHHGHVA